MGGQKSGAGRNPWKQTMKTASAALITYLNAGHAFTVADVYTLTLKSGISSFYTDFDLSVVYGGITYQAGRPLFSRTSTRQTVGIEVNEMSITVRYLSTDTIGGAFWRDAARAGVLDGAKIKVQRAFLPSPTQPALGLVHVFEGNVGDIENGMGEMVINVRSITELFNTMIPRSLFQSPCRNQLYYPECGVSRASYTTAATITSSANKASLVASTGKAAGWFDNGHLVFTGGANAGLTMGIKSFNGSTFTLNYPLIFQPMAGDTFTAYAGCDRTKSMCESKFNNVPNYRGEPFTPAPEAML